MAHGGTRPSNHPQPLPFLNEKTIVPPDWSPFPDHVRLKARLRPYVPQSPLFSLSGKTYYPPGSDHWRIFLCRSQSVDSHATLLCVTV